MPYIKRNLEDTILNYLESPEIIAVIGPRQAGKTTMINNILQKFEGAISISFDDQRILNMFEKNTDDFITAYVKKSKYLFIDEFQYAKNGGKILKYVVDSQKIKIIISGSSALDISVHTVKYLVGRILVFSLYPFDFREFLAAKNPAYFNLYRDYKSKFELGKSEIIKIPSDTHEKMLKYYEEYSVYGGYPRVVIEENYESKKDLLRNIYNTYFLREVKDVLGLIDDYKLGNLIKALALQAGNLIEYNELSRLSEYSYVSLKKYLNFLEKTYICVFIRPFYKNKRTELVKNPKVYFLDNGLRNTAINDFRPFSERIDKGALLENSISSQLSKQKIEFNFWRDKKKNEVDFILTLEGNKMAAIESKSFLKQIKTKSIEVFKKKYPDINFYISYENIADSLKKSENVYPVYFY